MRAIARLLAAALLVAAPPARAEDEEDARAAMRRGTAALEEGDAETALAEYELAKRLAPGANAPWFFAAEALTKLGRWREVVENLETYLAKNPAVSDADEVRARIKEIRARRFPARVRVLTNVEGTTVLVDGTPKGRADEPIEMTPGRHRIEARAPAYEPAVADVEIVGDTEPTVQLSLVAVRVEPAPSVPPAPAESRDGQTSASPWRTVGWVTAGFGAVGLAGAFVTDVLVLDAKIADYDRAADAHDPAARDHRSSAESLQTGVLVTYVASSALTLAGLAVVLLAPRADKVAIAPALGPQMGGLSTSVTF